MFTNIRLQLFYLKKKSKLNTLISNGESLMDALHLSTTDKFCFQCLEDLRLYNSMQYNKTCNLNYGQTARRG